MPLLQIGPQSDVLAHQHLVNATRYVPEMPDAIQDVSDKARIFIYNVGPWRHVRELGSAGVFVIQPCAEGQPYSEPLVIPGLVGEPYPISETEMAIKPTSGKPLQLGGYADGMFLAMQVLGEGPHVAPGASFRPFGVFVSRHEKPLAEELAAAHEALTGKYLQLVRMGNEAYALGPAKAAEIIQPDFHFRAARALRKTEQECPWLANTVAPGARLDCPNCGTTYQEGIAVCPVCKNILNEEKFLANETRQQEIRKKLRKGGAAVE